MARKKSAQTQVVEAVKETSVDDVMGMALMDKVLEMPVAPKVPKEAPIPAGYKRLPGGVTRRIRVNKEWIARGVGKPMIVVDGLRLCECGCGAIDYPGKETQYQDVITEAQSRSVCQKEGGGCGGPLTRSVVLETKGTILVKE